MAFGDLTYPSRTSDAVSSPVAYSPSPTDWATDWSQRFDAAAPTHRTTDFINQQLDDYMKANNVAQGSDAYNSARDYAYANIDSSVVPKTLGNGSPDYFGITKTTNDLFGSDFFSGLNKVKSYYTDHAIQPGPEQGDLIKEKMAMLPQMEATQRAQQAYDGMMGNNQPNGIRSASYSDPNFGQINGYFGQDKLGPSEWNGQSTNSLGGMAGAGYSPASASTTGAFSPSPTMNPSATSWGNGRRMTSWGLQ